MGSRRPAAPARPSVDMQGVKRRHHHGRSEATGRGAEGGERKSLQPELPTRSRARAPELTNPARAAPRANAAIDARRARKLGSAVRVLRRGLAKPGFVRTGPRGSRRAAGGRGDPPLTIDRRRSPGRRSRGLAREGQDRNGRHERRLFTEERASSRVRRRRWSLDTRRQRVAGAAGRGGAVETRCPHKDHPFR